MLHRLDVNHLRRPLAASMMALCLFLPACATDPQVSAAQFGASEEGTYESLMRIASASRAAGDLHAAAGLYRRANAMKPEAPEPLLLLGMTLLDLRAYSEAVAAFQAVLKQQPKDANALRGLANAYVALDRPNLAIAQLDAAREAKPGDHRIYNSLGVALDMIGDHATAQQRYREGLELAPSNLSLHNNLGLSLALSGDFSEAIAVLRPLAVHPTATIRNRQNLALVYGLAGDSEAAAQVARIDLDEADVQSNLIYYDVLRGLHDRARRAAVDAATIGTDEAAAD